MQDLKPQRAVKSDSSWHFVGAQCDGADPLDHGQSSPVLFPRAVGVATLTVSLFGVKALTFSRRKVVQAGNLTSICALSRCPVPRGSSGRYWLCRTRGRLDIELLGRRTDRTLAYLDQRTNGDRAARSLDCFAVYGIPGLQRRNRAASDSRGRQLSAALGTMFKWLSSKRRTGLATI